MAFHFEKAHCVVLGTFNTYILHPKWLADHGIIPKGTEVQIQMNFEEPGLRFLIDKGETVWTVAPNRLVVESTSPAINCGDSIVKVLKILKYTPVYAQGNNVEYHAELADEAKLAAPIREFPRKSCPDADEIVSQRTFHVAVRRPDRGVTNLQLSLHEESITLACNVHTDLRESEDPNRIAIESANRFFEDRSSSKFLANHFFGTEIEHHENN